MAMKETPRSTYKSMQGKEIDMHKLVMQNEMAVAVGNVKINARGDELGAGGKIIRKREEVLNENSVMPNQNNRKQEEVPLDEPVNTKQTVRKTDDNKESTDE